MLVTHRKFILDTSFPGCQPSEQHPRDVQAPLSSCNAAAFIFIIDFDHNICYLNFVNTRKKFHVSTKLKSGQQVLSLEAETKPARTRYAISTHYGCKSS